MFNGFIADIVLFFAPKGENTRSSSLYTHENIIKWSQSNLSIAQLKMSTKNNVKFYDLLSTLDWTATKRKKEDTKRNWSLRTVVHTNYIYKSQFDAKLIFYFLPNVDALKIKMFLIKFIKNVLIVRCSFLVIL